MVTVKQRIDTLQSYTNLVGLDVSAEELKLKGVKVTIVSYRTYGGKAYEYVEFWIVPDGKLEDNSYLTMDAYPVAVPVTKVTVKTFGMRGFRWFTRRWR